jgi:hypothetical protein
MASQFQPMHGLSNAFWAEDLLFENNPWGINAYSNKLDTCIKICNIVYTICWFFIR